MTSLTRPRPRLTSIPGIGYLEAARFVGAQIPPILAAGLREDRRITRASEAPAHVPRTLFDPTHPDAVASPHADYRMLRAQGVAVNEKLNVWMLSRYDHVSDAVRHPDIFSSAKGIFLRSVDVPNLITRDRPDHTRLRSVMTPHFHPKRLGDLADDIRQLADPAISRLAQGETVDFTRDLAIPLPISVIAQMLGVPTADWATFRGWSDHLANVFGPEDLASAVSFWADIFSSMVGLEAMVRREVARRTSEPTEDLFTAIEQAVAAGQLDRFEVFLYVMILIVAGTETTSNLLGMVADRLAADPELLERLRADRTLVPAFVEEMLRWGSPVQWVSRVTNEPYLVGETEIPAGSRVVLFLASANRDPERFQNPDRVDITRRNAGMLGFGAGPHFCLGAHLARLEVVTVVDHLLDNVSSLRAAGPVVWGTTPSLRGPTSVPVRLR